VTPAGKWVRERPLALLLPLQALLYFWNLNLLSPWYDEADQLLFLHGSLAHAIELPASGGHPPLYFVVIYYWMRLPLGLNWSTQARVLSVVFALLATVAADRLWVRTLPATWRWTFLALWTFSPFLLLYSRMGRSYSLQLLVGTVAAGLLTAGGSLPIGMLALALTAAVYIHPIPGFSLLAAANLLLLRRGETRRLLVLDAIVGLAYLPWVLHLIAFLPKWGAGGNRYELTGRTVFEIPLKLAYWAFSFTMGEAAPDAAALFGAAVGIGVALLAIAGARRRPELAWLGASAALVGFVGVARWNSYPFIPARMIFLFPCFLMLLVLGASAHRKLGAAMLAGMAILTLSGIWNYFHVTGFRNKQYAMPMAAIADRIRRESPPGSYAVLVDSTNADPAAMAYQLSPPTVTADPEAPAKVNAWIADPSIRTVWFLRSGHDISPRHLDARFETQLRAAMQETVTAFEPLTPLERRLLPNPPHAFQELLKFEK
jgi:hypothetical protein